MNYFPDPILNRVAKIRKQCVNGNYFEEKMCLSPKSFPHLVVDKNDKPPRSGGLCHIYDEVWGLIL
jgi:hypothetical protein